MKHEWRKSEKDLYVPKGKPVVVEVPKMKFFMVSGAGDPNSDEFADHVQMLYALSYGVRMSYKGEKPPENYYDYTVYPLEGIWDISESAKENYDGSLNKDELVYDLMIRQPDFVDEDFAYEIMDRVRKKKKLMLIESARYVEIEEGLCVQMMHLGNYDDESESFRILEEFCGENNLVRKSKVHREIYLSDPRKVAPEKLKTVLRFQVLDIG